MLSSCVTARPSPTCAGTRTPMRASSGTRVLCWLCPRSGCRPGTHGFSSPRNLPGASPCRSRPMCHLVASDGSRVLFAVDDGAGGAGDGGADAAEGTFLRIGEWDATGDLRTAQSVELERATWQHDIGVTAHHVVFIESPTTRIAGADNSAVPFGWVPGSGGWIGVVSRGGDGTDVRWFGLDPCLVTHVLGAYEEDGTRRRRRGRRRCHRAVRVSLRGARAGTARRPVVLRRRSGGNRSHDDRGQPRGARAVAHRRRGCRAGGRGRALRRVSTARPDVCGRDVPLRVLPRDGLGQQHVGDAAFPNTGRAGRRTRTRPDC